MRNSNLGHRPWDSRALIPLSWLVLAALLAFLPQKAGAQGALALSTVASLEALLSTSLDHAPAHRKAVLALDKARATVQGILLVDQASLRLDSAIDPLAASPEPTYKASLSLPLVGQASASASLDQDLNASLGLTVNPLYHSDSARQSQIALEKARVAERHSALDTRAKALAALTGHLTARIAVEAAELNATVGELSYQDAQVRHQRGTITLDELRSALKTWTDALAKAATAGQNLQKARITLASYFDTATRAVIEDLDPTVLETWISALPVLSRGSLDTEAYPPLRTAYLDREASQSTLSATWLLDPGLSFSASLSGNIGSTASPGSTPGPRASLGLSLSLGASSWKAQEREQAEVNLALANQALLQAREEAALALESAWATHALALRTLEVRQASDLASREVHGETLRLAAAGRASETEVLGARASMLQSRADLVGAQAEVLTSILALSWFE